jgi:hypothetical protein
MRNLDSYRCWRCTLCPCKVGNKFLVNFWNRTILLWIPCTYTQTKQCVPHIVHELGQIWITDTLIAYCLHSQHTMKCIGTLFYLTTVASHFLLAHWTYKILMYNEHVCYIWCVCELKKNMFSNFFQYCKWKPNINCKYILLAQTNPNSQQIKTTASIVLPAATQTTLE